MSSVAAVNGGTASTTSVTQNDDDASERFLKLLVAQMQNQDPMNPLDNAQVTSQMAQISTVTGIEKLNTTVGGLNSQLLQLQALQGATLVGRLVTVSGDRLGVVDGNGIGGFDLNSAADNVKVEILNGAGHVADTLELGALSSGRHGFEWPAGSVEDAENYRFRVTATSGTASVLGDTLMLDQVQSVSSAGNSLTLQLLRSGAVPYDTVKAFN